MIFWKKRKHPLPKFPPQIKPVFESLCSLYTEEQIKALKTSVDKNLEDLLLPEKKLLPSNKQLAKEIATRCHYLLDNYSSYDDIGKVLLVGAVRYFAEDNDAVSDDTFATGLDDDARILNHVLEEVGEVEKCIKVEQ